VNAYYIEVQAGYVPYKKNGTDVIVRASCSTSPRSLQLYVGQREDYEFSFHIDHDPDHNEISRVPMVVTRINRFAACTRHSDFVDCIPIHS
jgi:hypothetical protein